MLLTNPTVVNDIMTRYGFRFTKSLGQNFLIDSNMVKSLSDLSGADSDTAIFEVGPGIGTLTESLASRCGEIACVEIDRKLIPILNETLSRFDNIRIINDDILKTDIHDICDLFTCKRTIACANLPYYITTPTITVLLKSDRFDSVTVVIQKEAGDRLCAKPGSPDYNAFVVFINTYAEFTQSFKLPAACFMPKPNVDSVAIRFDVYKNPLVPPEKREFYFRVVRAAFTQRRKTLVNTLSTSLDTPLSKAELTQAVVECGFDEFIRGEVLEVADFYALSEKILEFYK